MSVYWLIRAAESLRQAVAREQATDPTAAQTLRAAIGDTLAAVFPGQIVLVRDRLSGYRPYDGLAILLVEIQPDPAAGIDSPFPSPGVYIVKVAAGDRCADLRREVEAWDTARPAHVRSDNIFVSLDPYPPRGSGPQPAAIVYGDAGVVLGAREAVSLEDAVMQSCRYARPRPASLVRLIHSLYARMESHFYARSFVARPGEYLSPTARPLLPSRLGRWKEPTPPGRPDPLAGVRSEAAGPNDADRRRVRRETLGFLATEADAFADPIDYLSGVWEGRPGGPTPRPHFFPLILRGMAHGDLHGRNVQVGLVDGDAAHCAVFDYESMRANNIVAWDFIKLEVELAVRLLDEEGAVRVPEYVRQVLAFWRYVAARTDEFDRHEPPGDDDPDTDTGPLPNDPQLATEVDRLPSALRRLAELLVAVRRTAHRHLGRDRCRGYDWLEEYDFLLTWYASWAGLYETYNRRMVTAAYIAAGVAARRMIRLGPADLARAGRDPGETGHRSRFLHARGLVRTDRHEDREEGVRALAELQLDYPHVLEVEEELALGLIELGRMTDAEEVIHRINDRYQHVTAETPARLGTIWKRRAVSAGLPYDAPALRHALRYYREAEAVRGDYFPAINVASLLLLLGDRAGARAQSERVLRALDAVDSAADPFWPDATRAEALLVAGLDPTEALACYGRAVLHPDCRPRDRRSIRAQLLLIRPHLDEPLRAVVTDDILDRLFPPA